MSMRRSSLLLAVALSMLIAMIGTPVVAAAANRVLPSKDSFYRYTGSKPLSQIAPGTVLNKRTVQVALSGNATPLTGDQLLYRTTDERGRPSVTVTTVLTPPTAAVVTRIVAYLSFYDALGSECDPSYTLAGGYPGNSSNQQQADEEEALIAQYLAAGLVVTVPDFEGTQLDWAAGQESGYGTLDGIRATESDLGVPASTEVGLSGYSGGSIAADWASELAPRYAPALDIVGVAEGGIPVDFAHNLSYINGSPSWSGVIPAVLVSLTRAFHLPLNRFLSAYGKKVTRQVHAECIGSFVGSYPGLKIQQLLKPRYHRFLAIPQFRRVVNTLIMGRAPGHPEGPLFMGVGDADGTGDGVMVSKDVEALAYEYCKQDVPVQFKEYSNSDHDTAALQFEPAATSFLMQRFAGVPFSDGCASIGKGNSLAPVK